MCKQGLESSTNDDLSERFQVAAEWLQTRRQRETKMARIEHHKLLYKIAIILCSNDGNDRSY